MIVLPTSLPGVLILEPKVFADARGFFLETWQRARYRDAGIEVDFVQDNLSRSRRHTLRGLHFQLEQPQAKLLQVLRGEIFDVAVDVRRSSPTFGQWCGVTLSEENRRQVYVPAGFAHGFYVLSEMADVHYKCGSLYYPPGERTLLWNDPAVGVNWPLSGEPLLSPKDQNGQPLSELDCFE